MNAQEIYDTVCIHLAKQGHRAIDAHGDNSCMYRSPNGDKCAFGILIPDDEFRASFEGRDAKGVLETADPLYTPDLYSLKEHKKLILALQAEHDKDPHDFIDGQRGPKPKPIDERLRQVAIEHQLSSKIINTLDFTGWK